MKRDQLLAAAKAKAEWRKNENNKSSILGGIGGFFKDTFGTWDGWKTEFYPQWDSVHACSCQQGLVSLLG